MLLELDQPFGDGAHILFVNGAYEGDDPMGKLMNDFRARNPEDMQYEELASRARTMKGCEEVEKMSVTVEQLIAEERQEGKQEGRKEGRQEGKQEERTDAIRRMLRKFSVEDILDLGYTVEEIAQAQEQS